MPSTRNSPPRTQGAEAAVWWQARGYGYRTARCLYCGVVTGGAPLGLGQPNQTVATVCNAHLWSSDRDEAREIAAGMGPWATPLSVLTLFLGMKPVEVES